MLHEATMITLHNTNFMFLSIFHQTLNHMFSDFQVRDILQKIKHHVDILEQSSARVSSRSEVYGAVQQVWFCLY